LGHIIKSELEQNFASLYWTQQANLPACSLHYPFRAKRQPSREAANTIINTILKNLLAQLDQNLLPHIAAHKFLDT